MLSTREREYLEALEAVARLAPQLVAHDLGACTCPHVAANMEHALSRVSRSAE